MLSYEEIIERDTAAMNQLIRVDTRDMDIDRPHHLNEPEPYVDLLIHVWNFSVFDVYFKLSSGRFSWAPDRRMIPTTLSYEPIAGHPKDRILPYAESAVMLFRQHFMPEIAKAILEQRELALDSGSFALYFEYVDRDGVKREVRVAPGGMLPVPLF